MKSITIFRETLRTLECEKFLTVVEKRGWFSICGRLHISGKNLNLLK